MFRTVTVNSLQATQGRHIIVSQEGLDDTKARRLVILDSDTLQVVEEFTSRDKADKDRLDEAVRRLIDEHAELKRRAQREKKTLAEVLETVDVNGE